MKTIDEALSILDGSKRYDFDYNECGQMTVLCVQDYHTGDEIRLDLSRLTPEMLEELQVENNDDENDEWED